MASLGNSQGEGKWVEMDSLLLLLLLSWYFIGVENRKNRRKMGPTVCHAITMLLSCVFVVFSTRI